MFNNSDFYPTPERIINEMLAGIDFRMIRTVLEPSAGKGNLVEGIIKKFSYVSYNKEKNYDIDCIEIDENLQYILKGKGFRVIHDDFLTYEGLKKYDLIVANFPFSDGDKHLLKALQLQENGGQIVCLLNSETLKNPYTNTRKDLLQKLTDYNAQIEYIQNAFMDAERKTNVEVALIKINIENKNRESVIINHLKKEEQYRQQKIQNDNNSLIDADFIKGIIQQYNYEVRAGLELINEYENLKPLISSSFKKDGAGTILRLGVYEGYKNIDEDNLINKYIKALRHKYWTALFESDQFTQLLTSDLQEQYYNKISELVDYDFSYFNIKQIQIDINKHMIQSVEKTILDLFEEFSNKHSWHDETSKNIHYYNGWKTNKAWKINKKVIIPMQGFRDLEYSWGRYNPTDYKIIRKLTDIEKVFNYLDGGITENIDITDVLKMAEHYGESKDIDLKYFKLTFYKKGTTHIVFKDDELLAKFNLFGSQRKGWLPPSYGKVKYKDMTKEEQEIIKDYEGEESYNKVLKNLDYYIYNPSKTLQITA